MLSGELQLVVDPRATKDLKKLWKSDRATAKRIVAAIETLRTKPWDGKPLTGAKQGIFSLRQGDYRILYEIHSAMKTVHIVRIGDRKDVYR